MDTKISRLRAHLATLRATTIGLVGVITLALVACDTNARFNVNQITFKDTRILGAWPARDSGGQLVRSCGAGAVDGFIFNMAFTSTQRTDGDPDNSIHPGDVVAKVTVDGDRPNDIKLTGTTNVSFQFDCLDPLPDPNGGTTCDGVQPSSAPEAITYCPSGSASCLSSIGTASSNRGKARNVLFVVDLSGSTAGFVDVGDNLEYPNDGSGTLPGQLQSLASDFSGYRFAQLKTFIEGLRAEDRFGVIAFREGLEGGGIATPCEKLGSDGTDTLAGLPWDQKLTECFGGSKQGWLSGINTITGEKSWGRSNLWQVVDEAYDFVASAPAASSNHIVVITDGPDTCGYSNSATDCKFSCASEVDSNDVITKIVDGKAANPPRNIQVHFVQFDSLGYPGVDPAQMEVACESGGHYQFINRTQLPNANPAQFQAALGNAMESIRFALTGHWAVPIQMSALSSGQTTSGTVYSLKGALTVETTTKLVSTPSVAFFAGGENGVVDKRPKLRKACGSASDCGFEGAEDECREYCASDTRLCLGGTVGLPKKNATPCSTGTCCTDSTGTTTCLSAGQTCDTCD